MNNQKIRGLIFCFLFIVSTANGQLEALEGIFGQVETYPEDTKLGPDLFSSGSINVPPSGNEREVVLLIDSGNTARDFANFTGYFLGFEFIAKTSASINLQVYKLERYTDASDELGYYSLQTETGFYRVRKGKQTRFFDRALRLVNEDVIAAIMYKEDGNPVPYKEDSSCSLSVLYNENGAVDGEISLYESVLFNDRRCHKYSLKAILIETDEYALRGCDMHIAPSENVAFVKSHPDFGIAHYPNNYDMCWIIRAEGSSHEVRAQGVVSIIEASNDNGECAFDSLKIYTLKWDSNERLKHTKCGSSDVGKVSTRGENYMFLEFTTDQSYSYDGFYLGVSSYQTFSIYDMIPLALGLTFGLLALLVAIIVAVVCWKKRKNKKLSKQVENSFRKQVETAFEAPWPEKELIIHEQEDHLESDEEDTGADNYMKKPLKGPVVSVKPLPIKTSSKGPVTVVSPQSADAAIFGETAHAHTENENEAAAAYDNETYDNDEQAVEDTVITNKAPIATAMAFKFLQFTSHILGKKPAQPMQPTTVVGEKVGSLSIKNKLLELRNKLLADKNDPEIQTTASVIPAQPVVVPMQPKPVAPSEVNEPSSVNVKGGKHPKSKMGWKSVNIASEEVEVKKHPIQPAVFKKILEKVKENKKLEKGKEDSGARPWARPLEEENASNVAVMAPVAPVGGPPRHPAREPDLPTGLPFAFNSKGKAPAPPAPIAPAPIAPAIIAPAAEADREVESISVPNPKLFAVVQSLNQAPNPAKAKARYLWTKEERLSALKNMKDTKLTQSNEQLNKEYSPVQQPKRPNSVEAVKPAGSDKSDSPPPPSTASWNEVDEAMINSTTELIPKVNLKSSKGEGANQSEC